MSSDLIQQKQQAHAMIEVLSPEKLPEVIGMLEGMLDPVARAIARAPVDEEPLTQEDEKALQEAREWLKEHRPISHEQVLAELGITQEEIDNYSDPV